MCWAALLPLVCLPALPCTSGPLLLQRQARHSRLAAQLPDRMLSRPKRPWSGCPKCISQCKPGMLCTSSMIPCRKEKLSQHKPAARLTALPGQCTQGLRLCCREKHSRRRRSRSRGGESDDEYGGYVPRKRQDIPSTCEAACLYCAKYLSFCPASVAPLPCCSCSVVGPPRPDCSCSLG